MSLGAAILMLATQGLRVSPLLAGSGASPREIGSFVGLAAVPVLGWAAAPAACLSVFIVTATMARDGELLALSASGIALRRLWPAVAIWIWTLVTIAGSILLWAGPLAGQQLRRLTLELGSRTLLATVTPGEIGSPIQDVFIAFDQRNGETLSGVFLSDERDPRQVLRVSAAQGRWSVDPGPKTLHLRLERGTAFVGDQREPPRAAISFKTLEVRVPVASALDQRVDFVPELLFVSTSRLLFDPRPVEVEPQPWAFALWRRLAAVASVLSLGLSACWLALFVAPTVTRGVLLATLLFLSHQLAARALEELMRVGVLPAILAATLPLLVSPGISLVILTLFRRYLPDVYPQATLE